MTGKPTHAPQPVAGYLQDEDGALQHASAQGAPAEGSADRLASSRAVPEETHVHPERLAQAETTFRNFGSLPNSVSKGASARVCLL